MANQRHGNRFTQFLLFVLIVILLGYGWYYISHQPASQTTGSKTTATTSNSSTTSTPTDPATAGWKTYTGESGVSFKYPSYMIVGPDTKADLGNANPTALGFHTFVFTPDPNSDFTVFSLDVEIDGAKNFILDLADKFISFDPTTRTWYANSNEADRPSAGSPKYKNLYLASNVFSPTVYSTTLSGTSVYGPFTLGDATRGTKWYLTPFADQNLIVNFSISFNNDALDQSTPAIKALKAKFDKDFPHIIKSVTVSS